MFTETYSFEWDDRKAEDNLRKHKISFLTASLVFEDPFLLVEEDESEDYGEIRLLATGVVKSVTIIVAYTDREDRTRIISARKANRHEQRAYDQGKAT